MEDFDGLEDELLRARTPLEDFEVIEGELSGTLSPMEDFEVLGNELPRPMTPLDGMLEDDMPAPTTVDDAEPMAIDDVEPMAIDNAAASHPQPEQTVLNEEQTNRKKKMSVKEEDEARWAVAKMFFEHRSLVENQLHSFNGFLETGIHKMFKESTPIEVAPDHSPSSLRISGFPRQARFWFGEVSVGSPSRYAADDSKLVFYPREARLRNMTYAAPIHLDINLEVNKYYLHLLFHCTLKPL